MLNPTSELSFRVSSVFNQWLPKGERSMKWRIPVVLAVVLLVGADTQKDDAVKNEAAKLQGTWRVVSAERDGSPAPEDEIKKITIAIKGDKLIARRTENADKPEEKVYD